MNENFIVHNFNLPNHCTELNNVESLINNVKIEVRKLQTKNSINNVQHDYLYEETIRILDYVGKLSKPAFDIEDQLELMYIEKFIHTPELAKKLWLEHYESIHHPYNLLKNRCFKLLDELDELYFNVYKTTPPNWSCK